MTFCRRENYLIYFNTFLFIFNINSNQETRLKYVRTEYDDCLLHKCKFINLYLNLKLLMEESQKAK